MITGQKTGDRPAKSIGSSQVQRSGRGCRAEDGHFAGVMPRGGV
jgi:hypothetical protein